MLADRTQGSWHKIDNGDLSLISRRPRAPTFSRHGGRSAAIHDYRR